MMTFGRLLSAVRFKHVLAVLLLGVFASPLTAALRWCGVAALDLWAVLGLWALLFSALVLAAQAGLIFLALRGLGSVFAHCGARFSTLPPHASDRGESDAFDSSQPPGSNGQRDPEPVGRPEKGGGDERRSGST
jgi:hypothetical protein